jgi:hypothetical protein
MCDDEMEFWRFVDRCCNNRRSRFSGLLFCFAILPRPARFGLHRVGRGCYCRLAIQTRGRKPTAATDIKIFWAIVGALILLVAALAFLGFNQAALGQASADMVVLLFAGWEIRRWMMREEYPLKK